MGVDDSGVVVHGEQPYERRHAAVEHVQHRPHQPLCTVVGGFAVTAAIRHLCSTHSVPEPRAPLALPLGDGGTPHYLRLRTHSRSEDLVDSADVQGARCGRSRGIDHDVRTCTGPSTRASRRGGIPVSHTSGASVRLIVLLRDHREARQQCEGGGASEGRLGVHAVQVVARGHEQHLAAHARSSHAQPLGPRHETRCEQRAGFL